MMFISFEGIEGCGKSTQIRRLADRLKDEGVSFVLTLEPGGTPIGKRIRTILLDPFNRELTHFTELMLYEADRAQHVADVVKPAIEDGKWVLCDRFYDATTVYQGYARGQDIRLIETLNFIASQGISPDLTFLLDCAPETGLERALKRDRTAAGRAQDRFEREALAFHRAVREGYLRLAELQPRIFVVDASQEEARIGSIIFEKVASLLRDRRQR